MPDDFVRLPLTLMGNHEKPIGYVMISMSALRQMEPFPQEWGVGITNDIGSGRIVAFDVFPHEVSERED